MRCPRRNTSVVCGAPKMDDYGIGAEIAERENLIEDGKGYPRKPSLKKAERVRRKMPHVCGSCRFLRMEDGWGWCIRPNGPTFDVSDMLFWYWTCDGWAEGD